MRDWLSKEGQGRQVPEWVNYRAVRAHRWVTAEVSRTSGSEGQWDREGEAYRDPALLLPETCSSGPSHECAKIHVQGGPLPRWLRWQKIRSNINVDQEGNG